MQWKNVYVFISSTFNDMHAERDHLVKRVFPELRTWCAERKLKLMDVDLRWGVSEADAQENKRVVDVCMRNIDKCRPFFLCFLGQRRGWVPRREEVNPETLEAFPELEQYLGSASVTELEILHALLHPMNGAAEPVRHARFYFRDSRYLKDIKDEQVRRVFSPNMGLFSRSDKQLEAFKRTISRQYPTVTYTGTWDPKRRSPELTNVKGSDLSAGRLTDFRVKDGSLEEDILRWLKEEISREYPEHEKTERSDDPLLMELDRQDTLLFQTGDGYIPRPKEEEALSRLLETEERPIVVLAEAGSGKTSLLADLIAKQQSSRRVYYRFVGVSPDSFHLGRLSASLTEQWIRDGLLDAETAAYTDEELKVVFPSLLAMAGRKEPFLLVLDGMDQFHGQDDWRKWLPRTLPEGCGLVCSLREDAADIGEMNCAVYRLGLMTDREDKRRMIRSYLGGFLKDVDEQQTEQIVNMPGSSNPLYLKIVLNELRQHGSFDTLIQLLRSDYGTTPMDAFSKVIDRVHEELCNDYRFGSTLTFLFFGTLACALEGLDGQMMTDMSGLLKDLERQNVSHQELLDAVYAVARELEPYLVMDGGTISYRYDSLRRAVLGSYNQEAKRILHTLLFVGCNTKAQRLGSKEEQKRSLYHLARAEERTIHTFFDFPYMVVDSLKRAGAAAMADTCRELAGRRGMTEFRGVAEVLQKAAARIDTYPETLFMELRRYGDAQNPRIQAMIETEKKLEGQRYFEPAGGPVGGEHCLREFKLPDGTKSAYDTEDGFVIGYRNKVEVWDRHMQQMLGVRYFDPDCGHEAIVNAGDGVVAVSYWINQNLMRTEIYTCPGLELKERRDFDKLFFGTRWRMAVLDGRLYGYFVQYPKEWPETTKQNTPRLVCLSTGEVLWEETVEEDLAFCLTGPYLSLHAADSGSVIIVSLRDGRVLERDNGPTGSSFRACMGTYLHLFFFGQHKNMVWRYEVKGDSLERQFYRGIELRRARYLWDLGEHGIFALDESQLAVLGTKIAGLKGYYELGADITDPMRDWSGRITLCGEDELMLVGNPLVRIYSLQGLLSSLKEEYREIQYHLSKAMIFDGKFYRFDSVLRRFDLETIREEMEPDGTWPLVRDYCPWNQQELDLCVGTGFGPGEFCLKSISRLRTYASVPIPWKDRHLLHAFQFSRNGDLHIGLITADKNPAQHMDDRGEPANFLRCRLDTVPVRLLLEQLQKTARAKQFLGVLLRDCFTEEKLDAEIPMGKMLLMTKRPSSVNVGDRCYVLLPNVWCGDRAETRVLEVSEGRWVCAIPVDAASALRLRSVTYYRPGGIFYFVDRGVVKEVHDIDLVQETIYTSQLDGEILSYNFTDGDEIFCFKRKDRTLTVYSLKEHQVVRTFNDIVMENDGRPLGQIIRMGGWVLLRKLKDDRIYVYDYEKGTLLFTQRMEHEVAELFADSKTGTLCMNGTTQRPDFWKMRSS